MNKFLVAALLALAGGIMLTSASTSNDDLDGKAGASGAPNEVTCATTDCHNTYALNSGTGSITISSPNLTNWTYVPGATYTISVTVAQTSINLFGLCFEALKPNGDNAGTLHAGTGTQIKNKTVGGFQLHAITHNNNTGASANSHTFTFTWDAPTTDIGDITFYVAGLAANANGNEIGDRVYSTSQVVTSGSVGLDEIMANNHSIVVFPNPTSSLLQFDPNSISSLVDEAIVLDGEGKEVSRLSKNNWNINGSTSSISVEHLPAGAYTLCFTAKGRVVSNSNFLKTGK